LVKTRDPVITIAELGGSTNLRYNFVPFSWCITIQAVWTVPCVHCCDDHAVCVGRSYFFSGQHYWLFNDARMQVERGYPRPIGPHWFGCAIQQASSQQDDVSRSSYPPHLSAATALLLTMLDSCLLQSKQL